MSQDSYLSRYNGDHNMSTEKESSRGGRTPSPSEGLHIHSPLRMNVSGRAVDESTKERIEGYIAILDRAACRPAGTSGNRVIFAFRQGKSFFIMPLSSGDKAAIIRGAAEIVEYDPSTGRLLGVGESGAPPEAPLIWWAFKIFSRTNFALMKIRSEDESGKTEPGKRNQGSRHPDSIWISTDTGERIPVMDNIIKLNFPSGPIMDLFSRTARDVSREPPGNLSEVEIDFSDCGLKMAEDITSLLGGRE